MDNNYEHFCKIQGTFKLDFLKRRGDPDDYSKTPSSINVYKTFIVKGKELSSSDARVYVCQDEDMTVRGVSLVMIIGIVLNVISVPNILC